MATGVPKTKPSEKTESSLDDGLILSYPGKIEEREVLKTEPSSPVLVGAGCNVQPGLHKRLYLGENLQILSCLLKDPGVCAQVRLVYIDPPFSTQSVFHSRSLEHAYEDILTGAAFVEFLRQRLILLRQLLSEDGSIYVHLDSKMVFRMKLIMDEVFGEGNFRNCITRKKCNPKNYTRKQYGNITDYILFYTKTKSYVWNKPTEAWTKERAKEYQYIDERTGRRFMKVPVHAPGIRNGETGKPWRGVMPPPGKHWQFPPATLDAMDARGEIFWSSNGNPRRKVFLDESDGVGVQDIWTDFRDAHNQNVCITGYPTEKPPELLRRIIEASSNKGDLVLDCFSGSGTTLAVADSLGRRWIGVDRSLEAIRTTLKRFESGLEPMGDFVSKGKRAADGERPLSLFSCLDEEAAPIVRNGHKVINDFVFLADASLRDFALQAAHDVRLFADAVEQPAGCQFDLRKAEQYLKKADGRLCALIESLGPCEFSRTSEGLPALLDAIISQQLSGPAASVIRKRVYEVFGGGAVTPEVIAAVSDELLLSSGLSARKIDFVRNLSKAVASGEINFEKFNEMSDDEVMQALTSIKGIGRWSAQMYLLFSLGRPDVLPLSDVALQTAFKSVYLLKDEEVPGRAEEIAEKWRPYRSIGCWYLYRYINNERK